MNYSFVYIKNHKDILRTTGILFDPDVRCSDYGDCPQLSYPLEGWDSGEGEEEVGDQRKRNSNVRYGRSHRCLSVWGVRCKIQEKIWTQVWGSLSHEE